MTEKNGTDRRTFIQRGAMGAGALWAVSLGEMMGRRTYAAPIAIGNPYGPISPAVDETTGLPLIMLPAGFKYVSYGWNGDVMSDGIITPGLHDGMAVVDEFHGKLPDDDDDEGCRDKDNDRRGKRDEHGRHDRDRRYGRWNDDDDDDDDRRGHYDDDRDDRPGKLLLVRNHEMGNGAPFVNDPLITYAGDGAGGNTNLVFNPRRGRFEKAWSSLAGTVRNCAGGVTPWGTWISSEEVFSTNHGWNFEVGPRKGVPTPLTAMGKFSHEAVMVDSRTGYVYETEDSNNCGFFKFVPNSRGKLYLGGALYMLAVKNQPNTNLGGNIAVGTMWDVVWERVDDPTASTQSCFAQGSAKGGARFARLEGCWWGDRNGYFLSTNGGSTGEGQVFEYNPRAETLKLIYNSGDFNDVDNPDNMTVTPRGGLLLCEDAAGNNFTAGERMIGLTLEGETFTFAQNNINFAPGGIGNPPNAVIAKADHRQNEWAGACYSPCGKWLFVNIQTPGVTFAITGPWGKGPL